MTPRHRAQALLAALRGWIPAAIFLLAVLSGLVILMLAPDLSVNPLVFIPPG